MQGHVHGHSSVDGLLCLLAANLGLHGTHGQLAADMHMMTSIWVMQVAKLLYKCAAD